jgi:hypothetical protein
MSSLQQKTSKYFKYLEFAFSKLPTFAKNLNAIFMEVITIESQVYRDLVAKIDAIAKFVIACQTKEEEKDIDGWVDSHDVCTFLKISARTLQRLRAARAVNYSLIRGKTFYKISEIQRLLNENIIRRSDECLQELIKNHTLNAEQRRDTKSNR